MKNMTEEIVNTMISNGVKNIDVMELIELNLKDGVECVECDDYDLVTFEDTDGTYFIAQSRTTQSKYVWFSEMFHKDLSEDEHEQILTYRGIYPDETVCLLEDWFMSVHKLQQVGKFN